MTRDELDALAEAWRKAVAKNSAPRILTPLPWRMRLRWRVTGVRDSISIWLVCRHRYLAAEWLWRATGGWS